MSIPGVVTAQTNTVRRQQPSAMPRRAARRMVGRAALAMTLRKQRTKEHLAQMLRQSKNTGLGHLSELMEARVYACVCA